MYIYCSVGTLSHSSNRFSKRYFIVAAYKRNSLHRAAVHWTHNKLLVLHSLESFLLKTIYCIRALLFFFPFEINLFRSYYFIFAWLISIVSFRIDFILKQKEKRINFKFFLLFLILFSFFCSSVFVFVLLIFAFCFCFGFKSTKKTVVSFWRIESPVKKTKNRK